MAYTLLAEICTQSKRFIWSKQHLLAIFNVLYTNFGYTGILNAAFRGTIAVLFHGINIIMWAKRIHQGVKEHYKNTNISMKLCIVCTS